MHQKSRDFIHGNFAYLAFICAVWSSRGRAGKKVTAVTLFRCPTVRASKARDNDFMVSQVFGIVEK